MNKKDAKKIVKQQLKPIDDLSNLPIEDSKKDITNEYLDIIKGYDKELQRVEQEKALITKLPVLKQKFITLFCSGSYSLKEIGRILNLRPNTLSNWLRHEDIRNAVEQYQKEENIIVDSTLKAIRMKAVYKLDELLDDPNSLVALQATKEILDRTGHVAVQKQQIDVNMSYEQRLKSVLQDTEYEIIDDNEPQINQEGDR